MSLVLIARHTQYYFLYEEDIKRREAEAYERGKAEGERIGRDKEKADVLSDAGEWMNDQTFSHLRDRMSRNAHRKDGD